MAALNRFFQKVPEIKIWHHFVIENPAATPTFCKQNFSQMHHIFYSYFDVIAFIAALPDPHHTRATRVRDRGMSTDTKYE